MRGGREFVLIWDEGRADPVLAQRGCLGVSPPFGNVVCKGHAGPCLFARLSDTPIVFLVSLYFVVHNLSQLCFQPLIVSLHFVA